ncbi:Secreted protein OS=Tsukamurella paurometabola (strain ATCC 8368 / DSM / CCUG 35730 / CIP 100753/ JCM 10117 / KCTC 9821 / NBRC 16120 / NCIMB 702349 / NCTC 13040) OX=521096 GN=Tpau_1902 PE=4 SV=1 [Tsukamurella paurometabola]|uniref:Secreted protein n=1 Tax=Tsukamurella paurometabola (strain ATCC 8368 / DSM 20162 / CCUG 35730 / CIP 100753 / JCM 10117 / KCTC 9821 / NBRC 16120 / NCIMB 702349 / NCTC 13040) TaxID=521096 RepID=D5UN18_TSUPD|nr:hypothetical protein [Tsukamurella paurometabola]ADG78515.1 hypothetical protein Tpau_1902 [Tsukamurella paurometabola DSM 20162]SUP32006.1 Uncharacterised protein [Tsukamurella paurometabola]
MNPMVTIGTYTAGLAVVFAAAFAVGSAIGPAADQPGPHVTAPSTSEGGHDGH